MSLETPPLALPGEPFEIRYATDRPSRVIVFAVDEGVLQRARYIAPRPIDYFLRKLALQVNTYQMVDMILPEFEAWARRSAPGGGVGADLAQGNLNPFHRRDEPPVAYWSGVVSADAEPRTLTWTPPDYFNGQLRVMAIAVNDSAVGHRESSATVRGPFIITPNVLTAAAPFDEFDLTVGLANQLEGSGDDVPIEVTVETSEHLSVAGEASHTLNVSEGDEGRLSVRLRARDVLGAADVTVTASSGDTRVSRRVSLSVRPASAYTTTIQSGIQSAAPFDVALARRLYPEFAEQQVTASASPLILVDGLLAYLAGFPHACAEQMTSKVFPQVGLLGHPALGVDEAEVRTAFAELIGKLRSRQLPGGGFAFWLGASAPVDFPSVYILHFLTDAAERGLAVPRDMRAAGLPYLQALAGRKVSSLAEARVRAYAIYVLTRYEIVTSGHATDLHEWLDTHHPDEWRADITGSFLAAIYAQLKQDALAAPLIRAYAFGGGDETYRDFDTRLLRDAQHVYLAARHFADQVTFDAPRLRQLVAPVLQNRFNTVSAAFTVLALGEVTRAAAARDELPALEIAWADKSVSASAFARAQVPVDAARVAVRGGGGEDIFFSASQRGYDREPPLDARSEGLELVRDYLNNDGEAVTDAVLGQELTVPPARTRAWRAARQCRHHRPSARRR